MDSRQHEFQTTTDFDLAAAYMVITGRQPVVSRQPGDNLTTVEMTDTEDTRRLMLEYAAGSLMVNVKRFAACRAWIYRAAKAVRP